jgi:hypothetical protein
LPEIDRVGRSQKNTSLSRPSLFLQAVVMVSSVDSESSKKNDGALKRPATDRVQGGGKPAFFTDEALHRLEAGLRAQREQHEGRRVYEPDVASSRPENPSALQDRLGESARIEPMSEDAPLAPGGEEPVPLPFWRRRVGALLLCALLLVASGAALRVSLKARTGASTDVTAVKIEGQTPAPDKDAPHNAVRSSAATPSLPPPSPASPNEHPVEAQAPAAPAERPAEAQGSATPAASGTPAAKPKCNIAACRRAYRSFRASDCTFVPLHSHGKRQICDR